MFVKSEGSGMHKLAESKKQREGKPKKAHFLVSSSGKTWVGLVPVDTSGGSGVPAWEVPKEQSRGGSGAE